MEACWGFPGIENPDFKRLRLPDKQGFCLKSNWSHLCHSWGGDRRKQLAARNLDARSLEWVAGRPGNTVPTVGRRSRCWGEGGAGRTGGCLGGHGEEGTAVFLGDRHFLPSSLSGLSQPGDATERAAKGGCWDMAPPVLGPQVPSSCPRIPYLFRFSLQKESASLGCSLPRVAPGFGGRARPPGLGSGPAKQERAGWEETGARGPDSNGVAMSSSSVNPTDLGVDCVAGTVLNWEVGGE